jgi:micrococcal nuclease
MRRRRLPLLLFFLLLAGCADTAPAQTTQAVAPAGMHYAASSRGTVYYAVTCDAWKRLAPTNLRFFRTAEDARAAGLRPSTQPGCAGSDVAVRADTAGDTVALRSTAAGDTAARARERVCVVARIVDGDTLTCDDGVRIRLLLIDAPELSQGPWGATARDALTALAPRGTALRLEFDVQLRDRYGRTLAYLWLDDGRMVNEELLRAGVAVVSVYPPNVRHVERLRAAVVEAQEAGTGLGSTPAFECSPADHRARRC